MATQVRSKPASKASVTKHPLFPAMVALWFGALFGLGSLAVRASLIESLVLSLSLDVLLPAAAPPLGMKARLILALLLAAIGVAVGAYLARRIARPRPVETPRRRGVGSPFAGRQSRAEALFEEDTTTTRRRSLTVEAEESPKPHYDAAPLPGGSPAILDVTQIDLSPASDEPLELREAEPLEPQDDASFALDDFAVEEPAHDEPAPYQSFTQASVQAFDAPATEFTPAPEAERQVFAVAPPAPVIADYAAADESQPVASNFHPPVDAVVQNEESPLELLAEQQVTTSAELPDGAEVAEYARMVEGLRHIDSPAAAEGEQPAPVQWTGEPPVDSEAESGEPLRPDEALPVISPVLLADPLPLHADSVLESRSVRRIETAELGELSPVELIERLALAMRQRAHKGPMPGALVDAVSSLAALAPAQVPAEAPAAFIAPAIEPEVEPVIEPEIEPEASAPLVLDLLDALPLEAEESPAEPEVSPPAPAGLALPAALRPIDFSDFADHDDSADLALPPRSFAAPIAAEPVAAETTDETLPVVGETDGEVPEDSYSSLLELGRPNAARQDFVRIEEPEEDHAAIEPVVIFPGHGARPGLRFAAPDPATGAQFDALADSGVPQLRRFDAPSTTASSAPTSVASGIRQDPEEAQRALRSALATLQRMSGAA